MVSSVLKWLRPGLAVLATPIFTISLGITALALICASLPAHSETLAQVYALARVSDPRYKAARLDYEASGFAVVEARAGLLPNATLETSHTHNVQNILASANSVFSVGKTEYAERGIVLTINQPLFKLAAWRRYEQAGAAERAAAATFAAAEQDLIMRTASAYMGALAARDALTFAQAEQEAIAAELKLAQARFDSGQATVVNLHDARARFELKNADVVAARNDLDDKLQALREICGRAIADLAPLPVRIPLAAPQPAGIEQWVGASLSANLTLEARRQAVEVARKEVELQAAGHAPVFDLVMTSNRNTNGGSLFGGGSDVRTNQVMLRLAVPIYSGGATSAVTAQAAKRYESAQEDMERDQRQIERQARAAYRGVTGGMVRVEALAQSVTSFESARRLKAAGYTAGLVTVLAVLDADRDLYAARRDAAQSRYDYVLSTLRLKQAAGTLTDLDLDHISRWAP